MLSEEFDPELSEILAIIAVMRLTSDLHLALAMLALTAGFVAGSKRTEATQDGEVGIRLQKVSCAKELGLVNETLKVKFLSLPPYAYATSMDGMNSSAARGILPQILSNILGECCQEKLQVLYKIDNDSQPEADVLFGSADVGLPLIMPKQARLKEYFVEIVQSPGAAYMVRADYVPPNILRLIGDSQYLVYFIVAAAGVTGILMWLAVRPILRKHCKWV